MQNDLISRSALIDEIESLTMRITGLRSGKGVLSEWMKEYKKSVLKTIEEQPTAYDVEKVVAELERLSNDVISNHFAYEDDDHTGIYNDGKSDGYDNAIDIVRNGGKE